MDIKNRKSQRSVRATLVLAAILVSVSILTPACQPVREPDEAVLRSLDEAVRRDVILWEGEQIPPELNAQLAGQKVVFLGEQYSSQEHQELVVRLLKTLHPAGFRQLLVGFWHAYGWQMDQYAAGISDSIDPFVEQYYGHLLKGVRGFNAGLPDNEKVIVSAVDINYNPEAYLTSLARLAEHFPDPSELDKFISSTPVEDVPQISAAVQGFAEKLEVNQQEYTSSWGQDGYDLVVELTRMQVLSNAVYPHLPGEAGEAELKREQALKTIVDAKLPQQEGGTVITLSHRHLPKQQSGGFSVERLGEYLSLRSSHAAGSTLLVLVSAARGEVAVKEKVESFDLSHGPRRDALFSNILKYSEDKFAYLALDDGIFRTATLLIDLPVGAFDAIPANLYDAAILLPQASQLDIP